jgi:hypothetical protein
VTFWQVTVDLDAAEPLRLDQLDTLLTGMEGHQATIDWRGVELSVHLTVQTSRRAGPLRAAELGMRVVTRTVVFAGGRVARWRAVEAMTVEEADARFTELLVPELVGRAEAAVILGVTRHWVTQLHRQDPRFPKPVAELSGTSVWTRASIHAYSLVRRRKSGRPAAEPALPQVKPVLRVV